MIELAKLENGGYVMLEKRFRRRSIIISGSSAAEEPGVWRVVSSSDVRYVRGQYVVLDRNQMSYGTMVGNPQEEGSIYEIFHSSVIVGIYDTVSSSKFDAEFTESFKDVYEKRMAAVPVKGGQA